MYYYSRSRQEFRFFISVKPMILSDDDDDHPIAVVLCHRLYYVKLFNSVWEEQENRHMCWCP